MGYTHVDTRPVGPADLEDVAALFGGGRSTRHCWCMAFCTTRGEFAAGWVAGGNRRRFEAAATSSAEPMGLLAFASGEPVGWCASGPRARYAGSARRRRALLRDRDPAEDGAVWLLPCLYVRPDHRGRGVTRQLVQSAIELARRRGAAAIEGWPITADDPAAADAFVGRRGLFEDLGFTCVGQPSPQRALMRLELAGGAARQE